MASRRRDSAAPPARVPSQRRRRHHEAIEAPSGGADPAHLNPAAAPTTTLKRARHDEAGMELPPRTTASALLTSGCRKMMPPQRAARSREANLPLGRTRARAQVHTCMTRDVSAPHMASKLASYSAMHHRAYAHHKEASKGASCTYVQMSASPSLRLRSRRLCIDYPPLQRLRCRSRPTRPDDSGGRR